MNKPSLEIVKKPTIKNWIALKIPTNPELFGGDNGTNAITRAYLEEVMGQTFITDEMIKSIHSVARARNKFLATNPIFKRSN